MLRDNSITIIFELCIKYALKNKSNKWTKIYYIFYNLVKTPFVYGTLIKLYA